MLAKVVTFCAVRSHLFMVPASNVGQLAWQVEAELMRFFLLSSCRYHRTIEDRIRGRGQSCLTTVLSHIYIVAALKRPIECTITGSWQLIAPSACAFPTRIIVNSHWVWSCHAELKVVVTFHVSFYIHSLPAASALPLRFL